VRPESARRDGAARIRGEVIVADNGSTDGSQQIAREHGARVVPIETPGYGSALRGGIGAARGRFILMGDADDSYDFTQAHLFVNKLREGYDLVMGNRFQGGILPGAMPPLHRYLGNPVLTGIGRLFFKSPVGDFHCGLRGFRRDAIERLDLRTHGMEFASEMVVKAAAFGLRVTEIPTTLSPMARSRAASAHLRTAGAICAFSCSTVRAGFFSIRDSAIRFRNRGQCVAATGPRMIGNVQFDINTLLFAAMAILIGFQSVVLPHSRKFCNFRGIVARRSAPL